MFDVKDKKENNSQHLNAFDEKNGNFLSKDGNKNNSVARDNYSNQQKSASQTNSTVNSDDYFEFRKALEQLNRELDEENSSGKNVADSKNKLSLNAVVPEKQSAQASFDMGGNNVKTNTVGEQNNAPFTPFADKPDVIQNLNNGQTEVVKTAESSDKKSYIKQDNANVNNTKSGINNANNCNHQYNVKETKADTDGVNAQKKTAGAYAQSDDCAREYTAVKYANYTAKIDYDCTLPTIASDEIRACITKLRDYGFKSICILASRMKMFKKAYPDVCFCAVIGYPSGEMTENSKCCEIKDAIKNGAKEIDVFFRISSLKDDKNRQIVRELAHYRRIIGSKRVFKLSLDCSLLTEDDFKVVAKAAIKAKADFLVIRNCALSQDKFQLCVSKECSGKIKIEYADNVASLADINKLADIGAERFLSSKATLLADAVKRKL